MESQRTQMVSPRKRDANSNVNGPSEKRWVMGDGWRQDRATLGCRRGTGLRATESLSFQENQKPEISDRLPDFKYWPSIFSFLFKNTQIKHNTSVDGIQPTATSLSPPLMGNSCFATEPRGHQLLPPRVCWKHEQLSPTTSVPTTATFPFRTSPSGLLRTHPRSWPVLPTSAPRSTLIQLP